MEGHTATCRSRGGILYGVAGPLADPVRATNCSCGNLIEGHDTHPRPLTGFLYGLRPPIPDKSTRMPAVLGLSTAASVALG